MIYLVVGIPCIISAVLAYLFGSINTAIIVTKIVTKGGNIKEMGSKNAGFTNVLRCVGKVPAIITIVCDFLKAVVAVYVSVLIFNFGTRVASLALLGSSMDIWLNTNYTTLVADSSEICKYIAGFFCVIGHMFPIYFKFKGGKGVVAAIGMILVLDWRVFLIVLGSFLIVFLFTRIISISSLFGSLIYGPATFVITYFCVYNPSLATASPHSFGYVLVVSGIALLTGLVIIIKHHGNIGRLLRGEEKKITAKK